MEVRGTPKSSKIRPSNLESGWLPALESGLSSCFLVIWQFFSSYGFGDPQFYATPKWHQMAKKIMASVCPFGFPGSTLRHAGAALRGGEGCAQTKSAQQADSSRSMKYTWVCLKIAYPYTQWFMIIIPTKWL